MHLFSDLVERCTGDTLIRLDQLNTDVLHELQVSGSTNMVKALQAVQLQKVIFAVGMFSIFEAQLQNAFGDHTGHAFDTVREVLKERNQGTLNTRFLDVQDAINALKHGRGRSYDRLIARVADLEFRVRLPDELYFVEGDASEVDSLVLVDERFISTCSEVIVQVSDALRDWNPQLKFYL